MGKKVLAVVSWIFAGALLLMGCAPAAAPASTPPPPREGAPAAAPSPGASAPAATPKAGDQPQYGGSIVTLSEQEPPHWDKHQANNPLVFADFCQQSLLTYDPDSGKALPLLAKSWEYANPLQLVVKLQEGVKFHNVAPMNGREMTAEDVVYSLERFRTPQPAFVFRARFAPVEKFEAVDKYTVKISFKEAFSPFISYLGGRDPVIVPKEAVDKWGDLKDAANTVGTGPFMMKQYTPGVGGIAVKNPDYWVKGKPYLDSMRMVITGDRPTMLASYRTGKIDLGAYIRGELTKPEKEALARTNPKINFIPWPATLVTMLVFPLNKEPFGDIRVRKAIDLAMDREEALQIAAGGAGHISGPISWKIFPGWTMPYEELMKRPGYRKPKDQDIAEAKRLLAEAGYAQGMTIEADACQQPSWLNLAPMEVAKSHLAKIGVNIKITMYDQATYFDQDNKGAFNFRARGFGVQYEPDDWLYTRHHSKGGRNTQKLSDPALDKLIEEQRVTLDAEKRKELVRKAELRLLELVPQVWLQVPETYAVSQPWVHGNRPSIWGVLAWANLPHDIWVEKR